MEGNGRRLGWIAIGIGLLALVVALGGRARESRMDAFERYQDGPGGAARTWHGPQDQFSPGDDDQRGQAGPPDGFRPGGPLSERGFGHGHHMMAMMRGMRGHGFLFLPFMIFGGLFKLALVAGVVLLVLKLSGRGRNGRGPRGPGGPEGHDRPQPPQRPEPYTGETTNL